MHNIVIASILGLVEGLTEFLPVSSTGHLILVGQFLHFTSDSAATFDIAIQLGAILAVVVVYRPVFYRFLSFNVVKDTQARRIVIAILPALVLGFLTHSFIKHHLFSSFTVALALLIGGICMLVIEKCIKKPATTLSLDNMTYRQAFFIGICQCVSLWPGMSRSGATLIGGLLGRLDYKTSAEFSFIIAVPVMIAATGYDLIKSYSLLNSTDGVMISTGFLVSFGVALLAILSFIKVLQKWKLAPFAWYRIAIGAGLLWLLH